MARFLLIAKRHLALLLCLTMMLGLCGAPAAAAAETGEDFYLRPLAGGVVQVTMSTDHIAVLRCDGTVAAVGNNDTNQCEVSGWSRIVKIWAADGVTVGLTDTGEVVNTAAAMNWKNIVDVSLSTSSSSGITVVAGLRADGTAVSMGVNERGGFAFVQGTCDVTGWTDIVQLLALNGVYGLRSDGTVVRAGFPGDPEPEISVSQWSGVRELVAGCDSVFGITKQGGVLSESSFYGTERWTNVVKLVPGYLNAVFGITADGKVYAGGETTGSYSSLSGITDLAAGPVTVMGIKADGSVTFLPEPDLSWAQRNQWRDVEQLVYAPGYANVAILRKDGTVVAANIDGLTDPAPCNGWTNIARLYREKDIYLGLKEDGSLICSDMQLDLSPLTANVENHMPLAQQGLIAAGARHSVFVRDDGRVSGAGLNEYGCLNVQNWTDITAVSAYYHTVGLRTNGTVVATGPNGSGQCNVSDWENIVKICAGGLNTIGLTEQGIVVVVGSDEYGQLALNGRRGIVDVCAGASTVYALTNKGVVFLAGSDSYGQDAARNWTGISAIAAGTSHVVGLRSDGTVVAAGDNEDGQCNVETWTDIVAISAGGNRTLGLKSDGTLVFTGSNDFGQGNVEGWTNVIAVSTGIYHTLALTSSGNILSTGSNEYGQCDVVY